MPSWALLNVQQGSHRTSSSKPGQFVAKGGTINIYIWVTGADQDCPGPTRDAALYLCVNHVLLPWTKPRSASHFTTEDAETQREFVMSWVAYLQPGLSL